MLLNFKLDYFIIVMELLVDVLGVAVVANTNSVVKLL